MVNEYLTNSNNVSSMTIPISDSYRERQQRWAIAVTTTNCWHYFPAEIASYSIHWILPNYGWTTANLSTPACQPQPQQQCHHNSSARLANHHCIRSYTILYYYTITVLYYNILYYTILYYIILYYTIPYHTIPYHTILDYTIL